MGAAPRSSCKFTLFLVAGVLMFAPPIQVLVSPPHLIGGGHAIDGTNAGDGLYTLTPVQQVSASAHWDNFYCPHPWPNACTNALGVVFIPSGNLMIISEGQCGVNCNSTRNALVEYNVVTGEYGPPLGLNCYPGSPFYPGEGTDYFVPCGNYVQNWASIVSVNYQNETIVANISNPVNAMSLAYDSSNGLLYGGAAGPANGLVVINPTSGSLIGTFQVQGATFIPGYWFPTSAYTLVYDSATDRLILPSTTNRLLVVDPVNGTVMTSVPLPSRVESLAIDPASNQLFAATDNATTYVSGLSVLNAKTYALEASLVLPNCVENECAQSNSIDQILPDPLHGDAYLVSSVALFTLNLSTLSLVGTIEDYGDGPPVSATYIPSLDQVISTYAIYGEGPGLLVQLHHGSVSVLTSLLWLPPTLGAVVIILSVAVGIGVILFRVRAWRWRRRGLPPPPLRLGRSPRT